MLSVSLTEALIALFSSAFVSATIFPGASEAVLLALVHQWPESAWQAFIVATAGNTLGAMTSYLLGRLLPDAKKDSRALSWCRRWGAWSLLLTWLPVVGDALSVAAGWLRISWPVAFLFILLGKAARYAVIVGAGTQFF
jgi:membrane protein YqaA with SNARE-associated domain